MNYIPYHMHTDLSNPFTVVDSATKYQDYVDKAKELGMKTLAFTEHGGILKWYYKKKYVEQQGLKYIHGVEAYVTADISKKVRDNYHVVLLAKNYDGVKELNYLMSCEVANNRDGHYYYNPRITLDELMNTSDNIIVTTACLGGILNSGIKELEDRFVEFLTENKHRCFLEIQHHLVDDQATYNAKLFKIHQEHNIPLIAGTDTHALNQRHVKAREILQRGNNVHFASEDNWDFVFRTYNELCEFYQKQNSIPTYAWKQALENTLLLDDMVEEFSLDTSAKYPKLYDNSEEVFKKKINQAFRKYANNGRYSNAELSKRIHEEFEVYKETGTIDYMLLKEYQRVWEQKQGIETGPGRGSVSGSIISYLLDITKMDSIYFDLNFFRFINPERVSVADIDTDYGKNDRDKVKEFLLTDDKFNSSEIVTLNTVQTKGAIKEVCRAVGIEAYEANQITKNLDNNRSEYEKKYPEVFEYLDILEGVVVSVGNHPAGVIVTEHNIHSELGTFTTSGTEYPVCVLNKKEVEELGYVKLDVLGLDTVDLINNTCKMANIDIINPDTIDLEDKDVWDSIIEDTTGIFQWESDSAAEYLKEFMSPETIKIAKKHNPDLKLIKWMSFGNGLIRPASASYRHDVAKGIFKDHGFEPLNKFLATTLGYVTMQEDIMQFLSEFCNYTMAESDIVRRYIGKKINTESLLPEIKRRFVEVNTKKYGLSTEECEKIIEPFLQVVLDATSYAFSWNHSDAYSCIGYMAGWLRYYHPYEFITTALNIFDGNKEKTSNLIKYANKIGIDIQAARFGISRTGYRFNKEEKVIVKGLESIKHIGSNVAEQLYKVSTMVNKDTNFFKLLTLIKEHTSVNSGQIDVLIKLDFFRDYGKSKRLSRLYNIYDEFASAKQYNKDKITHPKIEEIISKHSRETPKQYQIEDNMAIMNEIAELIPNHNFNPFVRAVAQADCLGYLKDDFTEIPDSYYIVTDIMAKYKNPVITIERISDGTTRTVKIKSYNFKAQPVEKLSVIKIFEEEESPRWKQIDGKWCQPDESDTETILVEYAVRKTEEN